MLFCKFSFIVVFHLFASFFVLSIGHLISYLVSLVLVAGTTLLDETSKDSSGGSVGSRTLELGAAVPLVLGSSVLLLFIVLMSIRCYFWRRYPSGAAAVRFRRLNGHRSDKNNDYLIEGMYM